MGRLERLYDVFGDLLYVVAKADGIVHKKEVEVLSRAHPELPIPVISTWPRHTKH